jgi:hypothetical protein
MKILAVDVEAGVPPGKQGLRFSLFLAAGREGQNIAKGKIGPSLFCVFGRKLTETADGDMIYARE